jgi:protein ImuB
MPAGRRIVAVALPELFLELADRSTPLPEHLAIVVSDRPLRERDLTGNTRLGEVSPSARALGVRPGQTLAQARARLAELSVRVVFAGAARAALERIAEHLLAFGQPVSFDGHTVLVDVTTSAHLVGGEEACARAIEAAVQALGHACRVAVASGPRLAELLAWHEPGAHGAGARAPADERARIGALPIAALGTLLGAPRAQLFAKLGLETLAELARLPRRALALRLGEDAKTVLALVDGRDDGPLRAFVPPHRPEERFDLEWSAESTEALAFVLKTLCDRMQARLDGRSLAATRLVLVLHLEPWGWDGGGGERRRAETIALRLPAPVHRAEELLVVLRARLERVALSAPVRAVSLRVTELAARTALPTHLFVPESRAERELPRLVAELEAMLGSESVGTLAVANAHAPSERTVLVPLARGGASPPVRARALSGAPEPLRWLSAPLPFSGDVRGAHPLVRFEHVEWWRGDAHDGDLVLVTGAPEGAPACVRVDRRTGARALVGWMG